MALITSDAHALRCGLGRNGDLDGGGCFAAEETSFATGIVNMMFLLLPVGVLVGIRRKNQNK